MSKKQPKTLDFATEVDFSQILTNPILDIAARLWDEKRYHAFQLCYRSMRIIDDLVDDRRELNESLSTEEQKELQISIEIWNQALVTGRPVDDFQEELLDTMRDFRIPSWPWSRLCKAMIFDLYHDSFRSFLIFVRYTEGAAIAPASIFMHLCGTKEQDQRFHPPDYDIRLAARPLALFSYLVHIMRDFEKDQKAGLNYFATDLLKLHKVPSEQLQKIAFTGQPTESFRALIAHYHELAEKYRQKAEQNIGRLLPHLEPRYQLSLGMIYSLYLQIFERVDPQNGQFGTDDLNPTPHEVQKRIDETISSFAALS
ncbi:MAG: squalene/phytoene synthase family protein [bacterium]|nr:squalene/phytoene synthase family protein [bacterium]